MGLVRQVHGRVDNRDVHLHAEHFYRGSPSPAHFISMPEVGHGAWFSDGEVSTLTRGVHTALLLSKMMGYENLDAWLPTGSVVSQSEDITEVRTK